jgi:NADP+-dependent farnesol dehydrogenase
MLKGNCIKRYIIFSRIFIEVERWAHKVALVTRASAGIGAQIVRELAKNGMKVIAVARRLDKLQKLTMSIKHEHKIDIYPIQCDITKEKDIIKTFKWANEKLGSIDVLINNAAVLYSESITGNFLLFLLAFLSPF